jgi:hypothetical protein
MLPWDSISQLTEYVALADREGADCVANLLGRFSRQIQPLLVAGRCLRLFSQAYPQPHPPELLWVLVGLCGVKQIEPTVTFSRTQRCIFTEQDDQRPAHQPFPLAQVMKWVTEGRFTRPYQDEVRGYSIRPGQAPALFRRVRQAGEETLAYFLEPEGSLSKAMAFLESGPQTPHRQQKQALMLTQRYMDLINELKTIRREESPDLYREALACYHRLEQLLGLGRKERTGVHQNRHQS